MDMQEERKEERSDREGDVGSLGIHQSLFALTDGQQGKGILSIGEPVAGLSHSFCLEAPWEPLLFAENSRLGLDGSLQPTPFYFVNFVMKY